MKPRRRILLASLCPLFVAATGLARGNYEGVNHWFARDVPTEPVHMERLDDTFDSRLDGYVAGICGHLPRDVGADYNLKLSAKIVIFPDGTRTVALESNDPPHSLRVACVRKVLERWPAAPTRFPVFTEWGTYLTSTSEGGCTRWDPPCLSWFGSTSCPPSTCRECETCAANLFICGLFCTVYVPTWIPAMWQWGVDRALEPFIGPPDYTDRPAYGPTKDTALWPVDSTGEARPTVTTHGRRAVPKEREGTTVSDATVVGSIDASVVQEFVRGFAGEFGSLHSSIVPEGTRFTLVFDVEPTGLVYIVRTPEPDNPGLAHHLRSIFRGRRFPYSGDAYTVSLEVSLSPHVEEPKLIDRVFLPRAEAPAPAESPTSGGSPEAVPY